MKLLVEPFVSLTGWSSNGTISAEFLNEHPQFIADRQAKSIAFNVRSGNLGKYVTKAITVDATGYEEIVLSVWSRNKRGWFGDKPSDFAYKISFDAGIDFYLPVFDSFTDVTLRLPATSLTRVRVTALHDDDDYLILSACSAVRTEMPLDLLAAVSVELTAYMLDEISTGLDSGAKATGKKNDKRMDITPRPFLDKYAVVKTGSETHQLSEMDGEGFALMSTYSGDKLLAAQAAASVLLQIPVRYGVVEVEAVIPGITLWAMAAEPVQNEGGVEYVLDSVVDDGAARRRADMLISYSVLIDCEARQYELLAIMGRVVRRFLASNYLWINGRRHDFVWTLGGQEIEPTMPVETLPKLQYTVSVDVRERREPRTVGVGANAATTTFEIVEQGGV